MPAPDDSSAHPAAGLPDDFQTIAVAKPVAAPPPEVAVMGANPDSSVPFVFGKQIAKGGMGVILEGEDCKLGRTIAVKVMLDPHASSDQARRFVQEAAVLGRLEHPNIVPIHDLGRDSEGALYYTMKLVKGRTLQDIINDLRKEKKEALEHYTLDRLLTIFRKVCDALAFAHASNIIHRDLKPENVMVGEFGEVLVMDWGIAKVLGSSNDEGRMANDELSPANSSFDIPHSSFTAPSGTSSFTATMDGAVMGTPNYMSPEQALGKVNELDERSDIFSLGGILYAILTLRPPVEGKDVWEVLEKVQMANITAPTVFGASTTGKGKPKSKSDVLEAKKITPLPHMPGERVPNALSAVAMKALTLDRAKRYQHVAAFSADVEKYQGGFATTAEEAGLGKQLVLLIKRHKGIFTTAAASWLLITALAVWFVFNLRTKEQRATQAEATAVQEKETARQALAKSQLDLAEKEFERGKFVESQKILNETPESFRDANWRFLQAHSTDYTAQLYLREKEQISYRLQFLPQGDRFAVKYNTGQIGIFRLTGQQIGNWVHASGPYIGTFGLANSADRMAFPVSANEVAVQEVATGKLVRRWAGEIAEINHVLLSPDGETVLAAGGKQLIAYATQTGAKLWTQPDIGVIPAFSPDGRTVAVLAAKAELTLKIQLLDTLTGAVRSTLEASADNPDKWLLQFNQAGDRLACIGGDEVILWNPLTGAKVRALHFQGETAMNLSPGGDAVATKSGSRIRLWDAANGRLLRSLNGASGDLRALAFSPDGKVLLSSHTSGLYVWPTRSGDEIVAARPEKGLGHRVLFDRDTSVFYTCANLEAASWNIRKGLQNWRFSTGIEIRLCDLAIHPNDGAIVLSEENKRTLTHVSSTGEPLAAFGINNYSSLNFSRDGRLLLSVEGAFSPSNPGRAVSVQAYPSGDLLRRIDFGVNSDENSRQPFAAFCLDDAAVATAALTGGITVWDWKAGTPLRQIDAAQTGSIGCLASSPDGLHLASGGPDRWIRVWDAATGRLEGAFRAHWEGVRSVQFSHDGREILSGSEDGTVRIHDAATGEERLAFYGLTKPVVDVDISTDGKLIAAITREGSTKVWNRQRSSAAALLPKVVGTVEPVAATSPTAKNAPPTAPKPALPGAAEGWENLLAALTPAEVEKTGHGWSLKDGELFSPATNFATLPLPGEVSGTSYQVRVNLRQLPANSVFHVVLPVADRMCGFGFEGRVSDGIYTGLSLVNGKFGKDLPGVVEGKQISDTGPHDLEVTVRLDGGNATITTTLDGNPLYEWTGPTAALSQHKAWATTEAGSLALGSMAGDWAVSEVKLKRLEK
jgi:serine/threonine protein kinase/WD40 repeat protein